MTTVWKKAEETVETAPDTGDILAPLKRVRHHYLYAAARHEANGHPERAVYYNEQAVNVHMLINQ